MTAEADHEWLTGFAKQVQDEEAVEVETSNKTRSLTAVTADYLEREPYRCDGWRIYLEGYGTEYQLEVPDSRDKPPVLLYPSSSALGEIVTGIDVVDGPQIVTTQTVADLGISVR